jgi:glycosyltransferase involved in cell wall biosynthesis
MTDPPDISVVVCTHNRAAVLERALRSLCDLATDGRFTYEIVVVNNASIDNTDEVVGKVAVSTRLCIRRAFEAEKGIVPARNRGIREARGRWIAFFDDDQQADPRWLAELYRLSQETNCRVVGGTVRLEVPAGCTRRLHPATRMLLGEARYGDLPLEYGGRLTPGCGNLMLERSVFDEVGLFEHTIDGRSEDTDLFVRMEKAGIPAWYAPAAVVHHGTPAERLTDAYLLRLARLTGKEVAHRQRTQLGRLRFTLLWLAKVARLAIVQLPALGWALVCGDRETMLGRRLLVAINAAFCRTGLPARPNQAEPSGLQDPSYPKTPCTLSDSHASPI